MCVRSWFHIQCKTLNFREHLIFAQIREGGIPGGGGMHPTLQNLGKLQVKHELSTQNCGKLHS